jgi:hypothetical protein
MPSTSKTSSVAVAVGVLAALTATSATTLGDGLWRTFGHQTALPLSSADAEQADWTAVTGVCEESLGVLYARDKAGPTEKHPLGLRFNAAGQVRRC